jgi:hypothetical protein
LGGRSREPTGSSAQNHDSRGLNQRHRGRRASLHCQIMFWSCGELRKSWLASRVTSLLDTKRASQANFFHSRYHTTGITCKGDMRTTKDGRRPRRSSSLRLWSIIHHDLGHHHRRPAANTMRIRRAHAHNLASPLPHLRIASTNGHTTLRLQNGDTSSPSASSPSTVDREL